jgi:hypothetical protein
MKWRPEWERDLWDCPRCEVSHEVPSQIREIQRTALVLRYLVGLRPSLRRAETARLAASVTPEVAETIVKCLAIEEATSVRRLNAWLICLMSCVVLQHVHDRLLHSRPVWLVPPLLIWWMASFAALLQVGWLSSRRFGVALSLLGEVQNACAVGVLARGMRWRRGADKLRPKLQELLKNASQGDAEALSEESLAQVRRLVSPFEPDVSLRRDPTFVADVIGFLARAADSKSVPSLQYIQEPGRGFPPEVKWAARAALQEIHRRAPSLEEHRRLLRAAEPAVEPEMLLRAADSGAEPPEQLLRSTDTDS